MIGFLVAASSLSLLMMRYTELWCKFPKILFLIALICSLCGSFLYVVTLAILPSFAEPQELAWLILLSRFLGGFGAGISEKTGQVAISKSTEPSVRPEYMVRFLFASMLGIGFGPLLSSFQHTVNQCNSTFGPHFWQLGMMSTILLMVCSFSFFVNFPRTLENMDMSNGKDLTISSYSNPRVLRHKRFLVSGCLVMTILRGYLVTSLEAATAQFLETDHGWNKSTIGLVVSLTFLCCIPVKMLHNRFSHRFLVSTWIRIFSIGAILATVLISVKQGWTLLLADCLLFPCIYISDALSRGIMMQHLLPTGSLLDANLTSFWAIFLRAMGQAIGPWFTRWYINLTGRNLYAVQQCVGASIFLLLFELIVRPCYARVLKEFEREQTTAGLTKMFPVVVTAHNRPECHSCSVTGVPAIQSSECNITLLESSSLFQDLEHGELPQTKSLCMVHSSHTKHAFFVLTDASQVEESPLVDVMVHSPIPCRGVVRLERHVSMQDMFVLDAAGFRGIYVDLEASKDVDSMTVFLVEMAQKADALTWHLHLRSSIRTVLALSEVIRALPVSVVIDSQSLHSDLFFLDHDLQAFDAFLALLRGNKCSLILNGLNDYIDGSFDTAFLASFARKAFAVSLNSMMWINNLQYICDQDPGRQAHDIMLAPGSTIELSKHPLHRICAGDLEMLRVIVQHNPAKLLGF